MSQRIESGLLSKKPWWRRAEATWWDRGIAAGLIFAVGLPARSLWAGTGWIDDWLAAGLWFLSVIVFVGVRTRLSKEHKRE